MQIKFQLPELLVLGAIVLLSGGDITHGWVFLGSGLFTAFARYAMEQQERNLIQKEVETLKESVPELLNTLIAAAKSSTKNKIH